MKQVPYYSGLAVIAVGIALLALPEGYEWGRSASIVAIVTGAILVAKAKE